MADERLTDGDLDALIAEMRERASMEEFRDKIGFGAATGKATLETRALMALLLEMQAAREREARLQTYADQNITVNMVVEKPEEDD